MNPTTKSDTLVPLPIKKRKSGQLQIFSSDDYRAKVGQELQDHPQKKTPLMLCSTTDESINDLPPGFEHNYFLNHSRAKFSHIPQIIKWECPPSFALSSQWLVAAGEESTEKETQMVREMRVLEALYPRISNIPPSPSVSFNAEEEDYSDSDIPPIPMTPIEERESISNIFSEVAPSQNLHQYSSDACVNPLGVVSHALDANLDTTFVVEAAITKINEQGTLIDRDLLINILNDPIMIEKLLSQGRMAATTTSASSTLQSIPTPNVAASGTTVRTTVGTSIPTSGNFHTVENWAQSTANTTTPYQPNTGSTYAIGQHGGDKQVSMESMKLGHNKQGEVKHKINKSCRYFKSKKGCRNGNNCLYKHDGSAQIRAGNVLKDQNAKRK